MNTTTIVDPNNNRKTIDIYTSYDCKPISLRDFDWTCTACTCTPFGLMISGFGSTEEEAIADWTESYCENS